MGSSKGVMDAPRDLRGVSRAHLMLGNSITDVVHRLHQKQTESGGAVWLITMF